MSFALLYKYFRTGLWPSWICIDNFCFLFMVRTVAGFLLIARYMLATGLVRVDRPTPGKPPVYGVLHPC